MNDFSARFLKQSKSSSHAFWKCGVPLSSRSKRVHRVWIISIPSKLRFWALAIACLDFPKDQGRDLFGGQAQQLREFDHSFIGQVYMILMVSAGSLPNWHVSGASSQSMVYWWTSSQGIYQFRDSWWLGNFFSIHNFLEPRISNFPLYKKWGVWIPTSFLA